MEYKNAYIYLFNAITQATDALEKSSVVSEDRAVAINILKAAQQTTEEMYIAADS
ncbi:MAG: hypothetical protein FWC90_01265 [Oscillospiraceae bacterium]|nr:hypothetical protein [Oscillospiraceae bacterium]